MTDASTTTAGRAGYHHGSLRAALVQAGLELSRGAGAGAIVLREATRRAGVTARAAYRHFTDRDALVQAVGREVLAMMAQRMVASQRTLIRRAKRLSGRTDAADLLRGVGLGYIGFALDEPGWFDVAVFGMPDMISGPVSVTDAAGELGRAVLDEPQRSPYRLLAEALAALVAERRLPAQRVTDAAITCWSGVHGFALLASSGPLRRTPQAVLAAQAARHVDTLVAAVIEH